MGVRIHLHVRYTLGRRLGKEKKFPPTPAKNQIVTFQPVSWYSAEVPVPTHERYESELSSTHYSGDFLRERTTKNLGQTYSRASAHRAWLLTTLRRHYAICALCTALDYMCLTWNKENRWVRKDFNLAGKPVASRQTTPPEEQGKETDGPSQIPSWRFVLL